MSDPAITWGAKVMSRGYQISGDVRTGIKATVPYLISWANCFGFTNAILGPVTAVHMGPMTFYVPYRFAGADIPVYAQRYSIEPCGADGTSYAPNQGLRGGEYFTHAMVTVEFEQVNFTWDGLDDPQGLNQLDPDNPILLCQQSVKMGGKMETRKGLHYRYTDDSKPVVGDVGVFQAEAKLVLNFPHVSYLPWTLLFPYVGKVNSTAMLLCAAETLLLESPITEAKRSLNSPTPIEQSVTLEFAYDPLGWNTHPHPNGVRAPVQLIGDSTKSKYDKVDFRPIFAQLSYSQAAP